MSEEYATVDEVAQKTAGIVLEQLTKVQAQNASLGESEEAQVARAKAEAERTEALVTKVREDVRADAEERDNALRDEMDQIVKRVLAEGRFVGIDGGPEPITDKWPLSKALLTSQVARDAIPTEEGRKQLDALRLLSDDIHMIAALTMPHGRNDELRLGRTVAKYLDYHGITNPILREKAWDTTTATGVLEWVPTVTSSDFIDRVDQMLTVAPLFAEFTMANKKIDYPAGDGIADVQLRTEGQTITEDASLVSRKVSFSAVDFKVRKDYSDDLSEDDIISTLDHVRSRQAYSLAYHYDRAILAGDSAGTHQDDDSDTATDTRKAWLGLRAKALDDSSGNVDMGTLTLETIGTLLSGLGRYARIPDLSLIVPTNVLFTKLFTLKDSANNAVWLPANTPGAPNPVVSGEVGRLYGVPVVHSDIIREDLDNTGKYTTDYSDPKTVMILVNRQAWKRGTRREVTLEQDKTITTGNIIVVTTWRGDFKHLFSTDVTTAIGYNIDVA